MAYWLVIGRDVSWSSTMILDIFLDFSTIFPMPFRTLLIKIYSGLLAATNFRMPLSETLYFTSNNSFPSKMPVLALVFPISIHKFKTLIFLLKRIFSCQNYIYSMNKYSVIGLMSGTSLDGLDIAYVEFTKDDGWNFEIIQCETIAYEQELSNKLRNASQLSAFELKRLDIAYGSWIGEKVRIFMEEYSISPDLVASHGHTVFHQPELGLTLQIGDGYQIMLQTVTKTICDFRSLDVANGGQGAPLVPIGDQLLFSEYDI